jgi:hypothetical protein
MAETMRFTSIRVPGKKAVDVANAATGGDWRKAIGIA